MPVYVVYAPDIPGTGAKRAALHGQHLPRLMEYLKQGVIWIGGPLHTVETIASPHAEKAFTGSFLVFEADNYAAARALIEEDAFYTGGVWDTEKVVVAPFRTAPRGEPKGNTLGEGSYNYLTWVPDKKESGILEKRKQLQPQHLEAAKERMSRMKIAGPMLDPVSETPIGSVAIVEGLSIDEIRAAIEADVYYKEGIWDREALVISPIVIRG